MQFLSMDSRPPAKADDGDHTTKSRQAYMWNLGDGLAVTESTRNQEIEG